MISLQDLQTIPWNIDAKVYGNNHASLIGSFTHWWVSASPQTRWALDSGPSFGYHAKGMGGGMCDALLCDKDQALGVLEVEGTRGKKTAEKIGSFFRPGPEYYRSLEFTILTLYAYSPAGKGQDRAYRPARDEETIQVIMDVSKHYPKKVIAVVAIDKSYHRQKMGVRAINDYYAGEMSKVTGFLYREGQEVESLILYGANNAG